MASSDGSALAALEAALAKCQRPGVRSVVEAALDLQKSTEACTDLQMLERLASDAFADIAELETLVSDLPSAVADLVAAEIAVKRCRANFIDAQRAQRAAAQQPAAPPAPAPAGVPADPPAAPAAAPPAPEALAEVPEAFQRDNFTSLKKWAWDQGQSYVTVYLTIAGLQDQGQVHCAFLTQSFDLRCIDCDGKHYRMAVPNLCEPVLPKQCSVAVKKDSLKLKLKKAAPGDWAGLDDGQKKKDLQHKKLADSGASTAELLKNMYDNADDQTRVDLAKAAIEGQKKRESTWQENM